MKPNRQFQASLILTLVLTVCITSCGSFVVDIEPGEEIGVQPDDKGSLVAELPTPVVLVTKLPPSPTHLASGLIFTNSDGTWWIDGQGEIQLLIDKELARPSPDGKWIAYVEEDPTTYMADIWLMEVSTGVRQNITNTPDRDEGSPQRVPGRPDLILI